MGLSDSLAGKRPRPMNYGQPHPSTHPHLVKEGEITPGITAKEYAQRRENLMARVPVGTVMIVPSHPEMMMSYDIPYSFRQQTDFYYLSGYQEPDALLVLAKRSDSEPIHFTMFLRPRDPAREIWDGPRSGVEGAVSFFGADEAHPIDRLAEKLKDLTDGVKNILYSPDVHLEFTHQIFALIPPEKIACPRNLLQTMRLIKSPAEIDVMRRSTEISGQAFREIMRATQPGITEGQLAALYEYECRKRGSQRLAYPPVFASGIHANTLHYVANDDIMQDGQMVLVDAGGEYNMFSSDITRTWPVNGKFTPAQLDLYNTVLDVQKKCIELCVSDGRMSPSALHQMSTQFITEGLKNLGLIKPGQTSGVSRFYPHSIGHWLGMDVHDVHDVSTRVPFKPGMMATVEPGIYVSDDPDIPAELRGMGVRIEDDVLITTGAPEILTAGAPKEAHDIEAVMRDRKPL
ncbi:XaaPro aminopeptidase 3, putative [Acanthamoeba castellanii str. Neff]|uniref:XaaPro aminopeptidase 3, putative n=1 Tax=Acanthamoeba castellanii (strain ATCC 30010 / Neff) TaxID=1257118 RepID=L8GRV1_ACACF|nr:XaaPro aminopeptidase 3, putative [Acanthamoeba castellanii str. Neff]ELR15705.1 XaaPro aminopeptidase 3, putative [Acanthamoeba castellanii str. Neff]